MQKLKKIAQNAKI